MQIESLIIHKNINDICYYVAKLHSKAEKERFIKDVIFIYIEHFSIHNNVYVSEFVSDRLSKMLEFDALFHKRACEICVMFTHLTRKHFDIKNNLTCCVQDCVTDFSTVVYKRSLHDILYCIDTIQSYTGKNFLTILRVDQVKHVIDTKYVDDSVWWMWNSIYKTLALSNDKFINNYIKHAFFIFRTFFNKNNRKHRVLFMKKIMCNICLFQHVVYIPYYNPLLIQIMMKINFIVEDYAIPKKMKLLYCNVLYNILPPINTVPAMSCDYDHIEETKLIMVNNHKMDSENKCLISKINEQ